MKPWPIGYSVPSIPITSMAVTTVSTFDVCTVTWYGRTQASKYSRSVAGASGVSNA